VIKQQPGDWLWGWLVKRRPTMEERAEMRETVLAALQHSIEGSLWVLVDHGDISVPMNEKYPLTLVELATLRRAVKKTQHRRDLMLLYKELQVCEMSDICSCSFTLQVLESVGITRINELLYAGVELVYLLAVMGCIPMQPNLVLLTEEGKELFFGG